jgi:mannose-6-phosphate isomerase-like protein (cupin superfamily)
MKPFVASLKSQDVYRISSGDTNRFIILHRRGGKEGSYIQCLEIFDPYGQTPPNVHHYAIEQFFVLHGHGQALVGNESIPLSPGDTLVVPPEISHIIRNAEAEELYVLTTMIPDEGFSELILSGIRDELKAKDFSNLSISL